MGVLNLRIDDQLDAELERIARERHQTKSEVARQMLRGSVLRANFEQARAKLVPLGEAAGYLTDEDVFRDFS